ncbi:ArnT family glycosyltransferase [Glaciimonas soli]|uniref:Glycosyltransferase RgtA/B/C/D-like domain-containing protein n=1 Tax=Glaciimonas soli TaxID=2590999 RepID=A0A843YP90_9BURK|nr:glycosyltransferase family 39 protein [Glaciimonas soli]MQR01305.1 hypothetical protein [Glaciimonas soli]
MKKIFGHFPFPVLLLSLLFAVKALYLAFCVTPLWNIHDEIGHYAYTQDIAEGKGIPLLGKAVIGTDIMSYLEGKPNSPPAYNWIAQHPPLYYIAAAVPLKIGSWFTNDVEILYRLPRIVAALSGALLILVLFRTFTLIGLDPLRASAVAASIGFIPQVSNLASITNHDIPLLLCCALATHFFARYLIQRKIHDAYWCAGWLAIAGGIKMMTPWALAAPMVAIILIELSGSIKYRIKHAIGIAIVASSLPIAWLLHNIVYFGTPFYTSTEAAGALQIAPIHQSIAEYLILKPVFQTFISTFFGLFGHISSGIGNYVLEMEVAPRHIQIQAAMIDDLPLEFYSILIFILGCICVCYMLTLARSVFQKTSSSLPQDSLIAWMHSHLSYDHYKRRIFIYVILLAVLVASFVGVISQTDYSINNVDVAISIALGITSFAIILYVNDPVDRLALYGLMIFLFFGSALLYHVYGAYLRLGVMRATQGRYLYPVIPLILLTASVALMRLRISGVVISGVVAILACLELSVFVLQVLPLYFGG